MAGAPMSRDQFLQDVANHIGKGISRIAANLGVSVPRVSQLQQENATSYAAFCFAILNEWNMKNKTIEDLVRAMRRSEREDLAAKIEHICRSQQLDPFNGEKEKSDTGTVLRQLLANDIIPRVGRDIKKIGIRLGLSANTLDTLECQHKGDHEMYCTAVFQCWFESHFFITELTAIDALQEALWEAERRDIHYFVKRTLENNPYTTGQPLDKDCSKAVRDEELLLYVVKDIGTGISRIAANLGIPFSRVRELLAENPNNFSQFCYAVLEDWHRADGTRENLILAMKMSRREDIVSKFCWILSISDPEFDVKKYKENPDPDTVLRKFLGNAISTIGQQDITKLMEKLDQILDKSLPCQSNQKHENLFRDWLQSPSSFITKTLPHLLTALEDIGKKNTRDYIINTLLSQLLANEIIPKIGRDTVRIAIKLGLTCNNLDALQDLFHHDQEMFCRALLEDWLQSNSFPNPKSAIDALQTAFFSAERRDIHDHVGKTLERNVYYTALYSG